jgi:polyribonucleotide nucleotidyltransferase
MDDIVGLLQKNGVVVGILVGVLTLIFIVSSSSSSSKKKEVPRSIENVGKSSSKKKNSNKKTAGSNKKGSAAATKKATPAVESTSAAPTNGEGTSATTETTTGTKKKKKKKNKNKNKESKQQQAKQQANRQSNDDDDDDSDLEDQAERLLSLQKKKGGGASTSLNSNHLIVSKKSMTDSGKNDKQVSFSSKNKAESKAGSEDAAAAAPTMEKLVAIGACDPALIIGPSGSTIQGIESSCGVKIDVLKNTPLYDQHSVRIKALSEASSSRSIYQATEMICSIVAAEEQRKANLATVTLTSSEIKGSEGVKAIIGRGGQTIKDIGERCDGAVKLDANVEQGTVVITGPKEMVSRAVILCKNAVFGEAQDILDLKSRSAVNIIFGKDFGTIRDLQNTTGAKLDIEKGSNVLQFSGTMEQVAAARKAVTDLLNQCGCVTMDIKASTIGAVYGKQGANIRRIQERTGAFVEIADQRGGGAVCTIMGQDPTAVEEAKQMIQRAIDGDYELLPGQVRETLDLGVATPAVIGRAGARVKELEKAHGVQINVNSESGVCRIVGKEKPVKAAKEAILAIVEPLLLVEKAKKEADREMEAGDSAWAGDCIDADAEGW